MTHQDKRFGNQYIWDAGHPAWAVSSYSSGLPDAGCVGGFYNSDVSPCTEEEGGMLLASWHAEDDGGGGMNGRPSLI